MAITTINLTDGTFVYQGYPTQAYGQGENFYRVGTSTQPTWRARSLINVPLGAIPSGAIINSAKLQLYAGNSSVSSAASSLTITFYARRITSSWTNSATWNNQPSATTTGQGSVTGSGWNNTLYELDVKTIVQAWVNGTANHGLMLIQDNTTTSTTKVFPKSTAVLVVDYTEPTATITQFGNFSSEAASLEFTVSNPSGGTLTAALKIGSATIFTGVSVASASGAKTITLSAAYKNAIYDALGNSVSGTATLTLSTTMGGVTRTHSATATVSIPSSVVPTLTTAVSGATAAGANGVTAKSYAIQNVGVINGTSTATAPKGTTIKSYKWTLAGGSVKTTKDASWVPTASGTLAVACTVTDGRGRTATVSKNIAVTEYAPPTLKMTRVERVTVNLNKVDVIYTPTVDAIGDTNRWRLVILTRPVGDDWSTAYDSGVIANGTSGSKTSRLTLTYSTTQSYELEATLTDGYNTRPGSLMIPTEAVPLAIGREGIGVGKIPAAGRALDVAGDAYFDGSLDVVGDIVVNGAAFASHTHSGTTTTGSYTTHKTAYGTIQLGPMNSSYNHIYSDLNTPFYFNRDMLVAGGKQVLHSDNWSNYAAAKSHTHAYQQVARVANGLTGSITNGSWVSVSFGKTFPSVPSVVATGTNNILGDSYAKMRNVTTTGFEIVVGGQGATNAFRWIAILAG